MKNLLAVTFFFITSSFANSAILNPGETYRFEFSNLYFSSVLENVENYADSVQVNINNLFPPITLENPNFKFSDNYEFEIRLYEDFYGTPFYTKSYTSSDKLLSIIFANWDFQNEWPESSWHDFQGAIEIQSLSGTFNLSNLYIHLEKDGALYTSYPSSVPIPGALWLFLSAIGSIAGLRKLSKN